MPYLRRIEVRALPGRPGRGVLLAGGLVMRCALGRSGIGSGKREGDGKTPAGRYPALRAFWRADRLARPRSALPLATIGADAGWCDDPADRNYNRPVRLPYAASTERMCRSDGLYDIVVDLAWNRGPVRKSLGSAIFLHVASDAYGPTEGCVALSLADLRRLLPRIGARTLFEVRR